MTQFSNTTQNNGLIQKCEFALFGDNGLTQISGDTDRLQMFTNFINKGYSQYVNKVISIDGKWQYDDSTYTNYAIAQTNLVANQQDYTFEASFIQILEVEIQREDGTWIALEEVDETTFAQLRKSMTEEYRTPATPRAFNRTANSIFILPAPSFNVTNGLKVKFQRPPSYFVYTDTTREAGFSETHHDYLVDFACAEYAKLRQIVNKNDFIQSVMNWEQVVIPTLYSRREKDVAKRIVPHYQNNK